MFKKLRSIILMAGLALALPVAVLAHPSPQVTQNAPKRVKKGLFSGWMPMGSPMLFGTKGAGIRMATQQRAARKSKNKRSRK